MKAAVLGATGLVGRTFVKLLSGHPWFKVSKLVASEKSARYIFASAPCFMSFIFNSPLT